MLLLNHCSVGLLIGMNQKSISRHQCPSKAPNENQAKRTLYVLMTLDWLPISFRIDFRILIITFKALRGLAPECTTELLFPDPPVHSLRSPGRNLLTAPSSRFKTKGDQVFAVPRLWNDLPENSDILLHYVLLNHFEGFLMERLSYNVTCFLRF